MSEREYSQFYLDSDLLLSIARELDKSGSTVDRGMSSYLREFVARTENKPPIASLGMAAVQADLVRPMTTDAASEQRGAAGTKIGPAIWGLQFLKKILSDLRNIICGSKKKPTELGPKAQAYIVAITTLIMQKFHVSSPTATGMAVLIILTISRATKKAFCETTDAEFLASLKESH